MTAHTDVARPAPFPADADAFRPDPHVGYATYRPQAGVIDIGRFIPIVIRHGDVERLMKDPRTRQIETEPLELRGITAGALYDFYANSMLVSNGPAHTRRRGAAARTFAFKLIEAWRPRIRQLVHELIDAQAEADEADFLDAIAAPLPSRIIAEILGAPSEDAPRFAAMVYGMSRGLSGFPDDQYTNIEAAATDLTAYAGSLLAARRATPQDDFLTDYVRNADEAGELSEAETLCQIVTLIIAGSDTTRFALTALISLLLQHRDQWEAVCRDASLAPAAVREGLRFEPSVGSIGRVVIEPLEVAGIPFEPGAVLAPSLISAQRDETVFADPHRFNIARTDHPRWSVTFGGGAHRCLGEALARAELEEALIALAQRRPQLHLAGPPPTLKGHTGIRGISSMRVRWGAR